MISFYYTNIEKKRKQDMGLLESAHFSGQIILLRAQKIKCRIHPFAPEPGCSAPPREGYFPIRGYWVGT